MTYLFIENDPMYVALHNYANTAPRRDIDWSNCGLAKVGQSRRTPSTDKTRPSVADRPSRATRSVEGPFGQEPEHSSS
jgi:hypothetical protein